MPEQAFEPGVLLVDRQRHWTYRLPPRLRDLALLARWDRPIGTWLLLLPCWWGMALVEPGWPSISLALLFAVGACAMRGAGCTINDMVDRELDARVARTRNRPIATGRVSLQGAAAFTLAQCAVGLLVLTQLPLPAALVALLSVPLVVVYPFMKRITWWPQAVLGLTFNWGVLVGATAVAGELRPEALVLYLAGLFWTLGYDTIYAHQDKEDDALIGVRSTALRLGAHSRAGIAGFYATALLLMAVAGWLAGKGPLLAPGLLVVAALLAHQVGRVDLDDPADCLRRFRANRLVGLAVVAALLAGNVDLAG
jgi:4-hydroxybenzoate polyprenyltransferase